MTDKHDKQQGGSTFLDSIAAVTPIIGSPSLDELFRDKGSNNRFNVSPMEADRQMQRKIRNGGK